ncbi:MAG: glycosyltransferase [Clostridiales bacterium]|nr:glycosyltransferase [Clostridiales bacterium]
MIIKRVKNYLKKNGIKKTLAKVYEYEIYKKRGKEYFLENLPTEEELDLQRKARFVKNILFSVVVPLYNSNEKYLEEMIKSVIGQTYGRWELLLVDGSPLSYTKAEETAMKYARADERVKYRRLGANLGISGNTNHGVKASRGDYIVFLDHDDLLREDALFRAAEEIEKSGADFLYSDEANFFEDRNNIKAVTVKPGFSAFTLLGINYIGHMCVVKRQLFDAVGGLRSEFDGSQDYDLVLRLSGRAQRISHLPYVLYFWRICEGSVASGIEAKDYCLVKAKDAIKKHIEEKGVKCEIFDIEGAESAYRIKFERDSEKKITIVVCFYGSEKKYEKYLNYILNFSSDSNIEIISVGGYNIFDGVKNIDLEGEYSFAEAANTGARAAEGDIIIFLDCNYLPETGFIEEMSSLCAFEDVGCVGGKLLDTMGRVKAMGFRLDPDVGLETYLKGLPKECVGYLRRLKIVSNVSCLSGGFLAVKRRDFLAVGGFDERMGVIGAGADLCLRLKNRGNILVTPYAEARVKGTDSESFEEFINVNEAEISAGDRFIKGLR